MTEGRDLMLAGRGAIARRDASSPLDPRALRKSVRGPAWLGLALVALFLMGFALWASILPLAGGAVASGVISPDGSRKTVQHLEGGIIRELRVRDGDMVTAGQALLVLEDVQPKAAHDVLREQQRTQLITRVRLEAEKEEASQLVFPKELLSHQPKIVALLDSQRQLFETRRQAHAAKKAVLKQRIQQLQEQIKGLDVQIESTSRQLEFIAVELESKRYLQQRGMLPLPELLRLQRAQAEIQGKKGELVAARSSAEQQIGESEYQIISLDADRADQISTQLDEVRTALTELEEKLRSAEDVLTRTVVTAPVSGTVVNLKFKTEGGVVMAGEPILDIVPLDDDLLIDARIQPIDIDVVHAGLSAQVQFSAFSSRNTQRIRGWVKTVSADSITDEQTKQPFYRARVRVDRNEVERLRPKIELVPGMPAEVLIVTGERTLIQYLLKPFLDAMWRSFRET